MAQVALAGFFCIAGCTTPPAALPPPVTPVPEAAPPPALPEPPPAPAAVLPAAPDPQVVVPAPDHVVTLQPGSEPRYALPESLRQFRFAQKNQPGAVLARATPKRDQTAAPAPATNRPAAAGSETLAAVEVASPAVATVSADGETPRYKLPDSLKHWGSGRKVPLYDAPDAAPWQATATEPRLRNAAVSCNYKDEGGVRGKATLLIDDYQVTRFTARIEMPNGGVCQFDSKKMEQRPFEQGIALQSKGDECVVRMWEQKHRITIAAYSCHKQCSKGSFSYLWPILMDTRIGTCY